jgi:hypothetical protein
MYVCLYKGYIRSADACCPTHSLCAPSISSLGPWTPPPPCKHIRTHDNSLPCMYIYRCCTYFADACCPSHSLRTVSPGPWTPPPPHRLIQTPFRPPSMYVCFMNAVCALLMPVAQPAVHAQHLQGLVHLPLLAGSFGPAMTHFHAHTYILQMLYMLC